MTTEEKDWILVVGYGSIGRRHYRNLLSLGRSDVRLLRTHWDRPGAFADPDGVVVYREQSAALADKPGVVIVCNPTSLHAATARAALAGDASVLLEKPVSGDLDSGRQLLADADRLGGPVSMAYCFRYHPLYRALREALAAGRLGRVFHASTWQASFLPDWHPWEDYRTSYAARADLGGGVVRTLDHELDMVRWTLGQPEQVLASAGSFSGIGVEVEDTADMIFRLRGGAQAAVHVSFARRDPARGMCVVGEAGSASLDYAAGRLTIMKGKDRDEVVDLPADFELNSIYVDMLSDALTGFEADPPRAAVPLADGVAALEMAVAALQASDDGRAVQLMGVS